MTEIVAKLKARDQAVLLAGMLAPRNLGDRYAEEFDAIYPELAARYEVPLYPFFLEGVATDHRLNQPDGLHPTAAGVAKIVGGILPQVETLVAARAATELTTCRDWPPPGSVRGRSGGPPGRSRRIRRRRWPSARAREA